MTGTEAGALAAAIGAESLVLTHIWEERGVDIALEQARSVFFGDIAVARPGLTIEW